MNGNIIDSGISREEYRLHQAMCSMIKSDLASSREEYEKLFHQLREESILYLPDLNKAIAHLEVALSQEKRKKNKNHKKRSVLDNVGSTTLGKLIKGLTYTFLGATVAIFSVNVLYAFTPSNNPVHETIDNAMEEICVQVYPYSPDLLKEKLMPAIYKAEQLGLDGDIIKEISKLNGGKKIFGHKTLFPELDDREQYYLFWLSKLSKEEQEKMIKFAEDGYISKEEIEQLKLLDMLGKERKRELILGGKGADVDWDKDGLSNYLEFIFRHPNLLDPEKENHIYLLFFDISKPGRGCYNPKPIMKLVGADEKHTIICLGKEGFSKECIKQAFERLENKAENRDIVRVYIRAHGSSSSIGFHDKPIISYSELKDLVNMLSPKVGAIVIELSACDSENAHKYLKGENIVLVTTTKANLYSSKMKELWFKKYLDKNQDGYVSLSEVYEYWDRAFLISDKNNLSSYIPEFV